jgi:aryl-alcohol dehydrogenase-like predicted oxidoreductase
MLYRRLGRTNLQVSELAFGAARGAVDDRRQFIATTIAAIEAGVNFVDTAAGYEDGACEAALGEALCGHDDVVVETKYRPYDGWAPAAAYTGSPEALTDSVEGSLRRLRRERIDILLGHGLRTPETLDRFMTDGCLDAMVKLRDSGKVRFLGISELSEGDGTHEILKRAVHGRHDAPEPGIRGVRTGERGRRPGVRAAPHRAREPAGPRALHEPGPL